MLPEVQEVSHLFEDDVLPQEGSVVLSDSQLWVILQRPNHVHHILLGQEHLQQFCKQTRDTPQLVQPHG